MPLLRFKTQQGDSDVDVIGECFGSLLMLAPAQSVPFVARFLRAPQSAAAAAVFALAESRRPDAFAQLERFWPACPEELKESLLLGMATFRTQPAIDFLVGVITAKDACARAAVSALTIHRHNDKIKDSVAAAIAAHGDEALQRWFHKKFL